MKVFVYWNLHRGMWSIKALEGPNKGRVIHRLPEVLLYDAKGKVSEAGRQRVLKERKKNVHAGIVGMLRPADRSVTFHIEDAGDRITYNPYKYNSFVHVIDGSVFDGAAHVFLTADRAVYAA